jgi:hypothetical protein
MNTAMQIGNAFGVAIVGVILFAALAAHAPRSVAQVRPQLVARLDAAGTPPAARERVLAGFRACFVDRAREEDPAAVPPSCRSGSGLRLLAPAATAAREDNFVAAIQRALLYEVAVFAVTFALLLALPLGAVRRAGRARRRAARTPA